MNYTIRPARSGDYPRIMEIWASAVKATHDFLAPSDFDLFQVLIPEEFLPHLDAFVLADENGVLQAFFGTSEDNLEMLFVEDASRGKGIGKIAIAYVLDVLQVYKVDVNEQNHQALEFYRARGYVQTGRSERDGMGKAYPLLHLHYPHKTEER